MAGRIPQPFIDELLGRVDIVDIIDSRVPLKSAGRGEFKACCPFHEEKTPSFTVSTDKQFYHCFGCGAHGSAIGFLMEYAHLDFVEAIEELAAHTGQEIPYEHSQKPVTKPADTDDLITLLDKANSYFKQQLRDDSPQAKKAVEYLKNRGLSGQTARDFEIGLALDSWDGLVKALGKNEKTLRQLEKAGLLTEREGGGYYDKFRGRIMFPIHDFKGRVVAFGGRVLGKSEPKYLNSPETPVFHKGSELYGLHKARAAIKSAGFALVVEGYMDVIALAQFDINNAVATLGTATTRAHLDRLFRYTEQIVFCFDGDSAGERAAWRALENTMAVITARREVRFLFLPKGHDPDSLVQEKGRQGFEHLIEKAVPLSEFLLTSLVQQTDLSHLEGRARLLALARPHLQALEEGPLKQLLIEQLARMARTDTASAREQLAGIPARVQRPPARRTASSQTGAGALSPIARAISLLIQYPGLNQTAGSQIRALKGFENRGLDLLLELSGVLNASPELATGALVERYRNTPSQKALEKLAVQHHLITDQALLELEFTEILATLHKQWLGQQRDRLLEKLKSGQITEKEAANQLKLLDIQRLKK